MDNLTARLLRLREFGAAVGFLIIFVVFVFIAPNFLSVSNLGSMLTMASTLGIISIGISFLMISGEFDLSVGSVFALTPMVMALMVNYGLQPVVSLILALCLALFIGFLNGVITIKGEIPSFIVTLGSMMLLRGIILVTTGGFPVSYNGASGLIEGMNLRIMDTSFRSSSIWFLAIALVFTVILTRTRFGNWVFATGAQPNVAQELGINTARVKIINFMICALLAGFAGVLDLGRFMVVEATKGRGLELEAIAAAVIGGNLLQGGYGTIIGTLIGALLIGMVRSGLILAGAPSYWYQAFVGGVLIVAVLLNIQIKKATIG